MEDFLPPWMGQWVRNDPFPFKEVIFMHARRRRRSPLPGLAVTAGLLMILLGLLLARCSLDALPSAAALQGKVVRLAENQELELQLQDPQLPNGCEVTSLAMVLTWAGCPVDKVELYENWLPREDFSYDQWGRLTGPDPAEAYAGDAASESQGWYCFEGPLVKAGSAWLASQGSSLTVQSLSGLSQSQLDDLLDQGTPLVVWVTLDYSDPVVCSSGWYLEDGTEYLPYCNLHCVAVVSREGEGYLTADPLEGWKWVEGDTFWATFSAMGCRAVAVVQP